MKKLMIVTIALALIACATSGPPPDPITAEEIVHLSAGGPDGPALIAALETRPVGFPLTYQGLSDLAAMGVPPEVIDTVVAYAVDRRARAIAPRYAVYYPAPAWGWWGPGWGWGPRWCGPGYWR